MSKKTFKKTDIEAVVNEDTDENSPLVLEHEGEWTGGGKYQSQEVILRDTATGKYYLFDSIRAGSYFSDYYYTIDDMDDEIELVQVALITKVIKVWTAVELGEVNIT